MTDHRHDTDTAHERTGDEAFDRLYREAEQHDDYWAARAALDFTESVCREMDRAGVTRSELARRMGTSPAYVTKILRGESNFTLASMVKLARALEVSLRIDLGGDAAGGVREPAAQPVSEPPVTSAAAETAVTVP